MVINEYQINLGEESGRDLVKEAMKAFLKLASKLIYWKTGSETIAHLPEQDGSTP